MFEARCLFVAILWSCPFRYVTFAREEEAVRCIQAVNGYILDGRPLK
jgi:RNA recognition motif-containing protein